MPLLVFLLPKQLEPAENSAASDVFNPPFHTGSNEFFAAMLASNKQV
jgi:hypothetical protein